MSDVKTAKRKSASSPDWRQLRGPGMGGPHYAVSRDYSAGHITPQRRDELTGLLTQWLNDEKITSIDHVVSDGARAICELAVFPEGLVPNMGELLEKTADKVAAMRLRADHKYVQAIFAAYDYMLKHKAAGVTPQQLQAFTDKVIYKPRGGAFPGALGEYCSAEGTGAYYWHSMNSVVRHDKLRHIVEAHLAGEVPQISEVASHSAARALAELSTFAEGVVPDLPELLQKTADQVAAQSPLSLGEAEHVKSTYDYLIGHKAKGVTKTQRNAFLKKVAPELIGEVVTLKTELEEMLENGDNLGIYDKLFSVIHYDARNLTRLAEETADVVGANKLDMAGIEAMEAPLAKAFALGALERYGDTANFHMDSIREDILHSTRGVLAGSELRQSVVDAFKAADLRAFETNHPVRAKIQRVFAGAAHFLQSAGRQPAPFNTGPG